MFHCIFNSSFFLFFNIQWEHQAFYLFPKPMETKTLALATTTKGPFTLNESEFKSKNLHHEWQSCIVIINTSIGVRFLWTWIGPLPFNNCHTPNLAVRNTYKKAAHAPLAISVLSQSASVLGQASTQLCVVALRDFQETL